MKLYDYFRSSAAYRVRIALNLKRVNCESVAVSLPKGEQQSAPYRTLNPQGLVPALVLDDDQVLSQSLAICEYLDECYPEPPLLPADPVGRARVRALAQVMACDMHPLNNLRVLNYLTGPLGLGDDAKLGWYRHWIAEGFTSLEGMLSSAKTTGRFCYGDTPTLADVCLVPQVFNANRFECDLSDYPTIRRINEACAALPEFQRARPSKQSAAS